MAKNNATCQYCGKGYYICRSCESIFSWRQVACSPECFRKLQNKKAKAEKDASIIAETPKVEIPFEGDEPKIEQVKKTTPKKSPSIKKKK